MGANVVLGGSGHYFPFRRYPCRHVFTHDWDSAEKGNNDLSPPVRHLPPCEYVAHKSLSHQHNKYEHPENPEQLTRLLIRAVHHRAEHVHVNNDEEGLRAGRVHVAE